MISKDVIERILTAGCSAPSGGNSQPWEFEVRGDTVTVILKPEKDHPVLNVFNRGTWIAHGALIENMCIEATEQGVTPIVTIFPETEAGRISSTIQFIKAEHGDRDPLEPFIFKRTTNRKHYLQKSIPREVVDQLKQAAGSVGDGKAIFINDRGSVSKIAKALSVSDKITFENKVLHNLFFKEIVWTKEQEKEKGGGLFLQTLELKPPQRAMMHLLRHWPAMKILAKIGIAKQIAKENMQTHASGAILCAVSVPKGKESFLEAGRQIERIWLTATRYGLSVQLNTGLFFFWQNIHFGRPNSVFSQGEIDDIDFAYKTIASVSNAGEDIITAIIRIGYSNGGPSACSTKPAPVIKWIN